MGKSCQIFCRSRWSCSFLFDSVVLASVLSRYGSCPGNLCPNSGCFQTGMPLLATHSSSLTSAPNFAFELTSRKTSDDDMRGLDLGDVRCILSGSERVQPATVWRFTDRFVRFNLRPEVMQPAYGLAEATVYVATRGPRLSSGNRPLRI